MSKMFEILFWTQKCGDLPKKLYKASNTKASSKNTRSNQNIFFFQNSRKTLSDVNATLSKPHLTTKHFQNVYVGIWFN